MPNMPLPINGKRELLQWRQSPQHEYTHVCMYVNRADLIKQHTHGPCEGLDDLGPGTRPVQGQGHLQRVGATLQALPPLWHRP